MTTLNRSTIRRLQNLPQVSSVWEGDRRSLALPGSAAADEEHGDCILWVDGQDAVVRAMDVVPSDTGLEAVARTLLRAFEHPHGGGQPMRPTKIVVCDREIQFFLRGVLQELDITIEYVSELPLINEIYRGLQASLESRSMKGVQPFEEQLDEAANVLWKDAPWDFLDEEKIIAIHLNHSDVDTFYVSTLGMLGVEYGVLMYRSLHSLKQFRQRVLTSSNSSEALEEAFLQQDCLFLTFERASEYHVIDSLSEPDVLEPEEELCPTFGNLHPLEGMRPYLYDEEAVAALLALEAFHRFVKQHHKKLNQDPFPAVKSRYRIPDPEHPTQKLSIEVETLPDLAEELFEMTVSPQSPHLPEFLEGTGMPVLHDDLVPENSFFSLGAIPWDLLEMLRPSVKFHQPADHDFPSKADGFPVILIQTSRPKALQMIEELKSSGGLKAICFNPGEDPFVQESYDLGLLQTHDGTLHLFGEFGETDPVHVKARKKWDQRCKKTNGYCGLVIAMGLTGASRGNPQLKDMLGLFEARSLSSHDLGLGPLQMMPSIEFPTF